MLKAVIFDFNGTLFWDSRFHESAWNRMSEKIRGRAFTSDEFHHHVHGRVNAAIIGFLLGHQPDTEEYWRIANRKEEIYRGLCLKEPSIFSLAEGAEEFLDGLTGSKIPLAIATASGPDNIDFYFEHLPLTRWFTKENVVFDDGTFPGKPEPDIVILAARKLGFKPSECVVFEDSASGIESARRAGIGRIIGIASGSPVEELLTKKGVSQAVKNFRGLNAGILRS